MNDMLARVRVVMTASATLISAAVVFVASVSPALPEDWQTVAANVIAALSGAVVFIRRHTPVPPAERGVLEVPVENVPLDRYVFD